MRHRVLMVSDMFHPQVGGVESHIYVLAQHLMRQGHKVVVLTHHYGERQGVRYLTGGLKVYHLPRVDMYQSCTFPTLFGSFRVFRVVCLRERITLVHGHGNFSTLAHESVMHAGTLGLKTVFTDHSLFRFDDVASILTNKLLKFTCSNVHAVVCVSHTSKENTVLRACAPPHRVFVIPNAVDSRQFEPDLEAHARWRARHPGAFTVVVLSRLAYRKGADLLAALVPDVCRRHPHVRFLVGGDGPKKALLERVVEAHGLRSRVTFAGFVPHEEAAAFLSQGDLFLNVSLTEAFCMAIVEAASVGLPVVATAVGGVPEVLPPSMVALAEPERAAVAAALAEAVGRRGAPEVVEKARWEQHRRVAAMYSWEDVAARTEKVYDFIQGHQVRDDTLLGRMRRFHQCGAVAGKLFACVALVDTWVHRAIAWAQPAEEIDVAPDVPAGSL